MELKDTIELMNSKDYKERFKAEYYQVGIRYEKLAKLVKDYKENKLSFTPNCSLELLQEQLEAMNKYLFILEQRAKIEKVEL